jgi:hypothetical protein
MDRDRLRRTALVIAVAVPVGVALDRWVLNPTTGLVAGLSPLVGLVVRAVVLFGYVFAVLSALSVLQDETWSDELPRLVLYSGLLSGIAVTVG